MEVMDMVNHPKHYQGKNGLEVIDVIEAFVSDLSGVEASDTANILKYACRWKQKNGIEDLEKIVWYTQHLINHLKHNNEEIQYDVKQILFSDEEEAIRTLVALKSLIDIYGRATVNDYYEISEVSSFRNKYIDTKYGWEYGWKDLSTAYIVRSAHGSFIKLPEVIKIDK